MTDLTEQWKKGELPSGEYYIRVDGVEDRACYFAGFGFTEADPDEIECILAPVPSYEEYLEMKGHCAAYSDINQWQKEEISAYKRLVAELKQENSQLKELLRECKTPLEVYNEMFGNKEELLTKIDEVLK